MGVSKTKTDNLSSCVFKKTILQSLIVTVPIMRINEKTQIVEKLATKYVCPKYLRKLLVTAFPSNTNVSPDLST